MKPVNLSLLVTILVSSFVFCFSSLSWGNSYSKGRHVCEDFKGVEQDYKNSLQNTDEYSKIGDQIAYAACLVMKGENAQGMYLMHNVADRHNHIFAALFIAEYIETNGRFEFPFDYENINEAIRAFYRVLAYIDFEPGYPLSKPINYTVYEKFDQMELRASYHIPMLYFVRFSLGFYGLYHEHLHTSAGYNGDKSLPTFPKYRDDTRESLRKVIESADHCLALPKKRHFFADHYEYFQKQCRLLKETALILQPLEEKRLVLLATESCKRDLPSCEEYNNLHKQMKDIMNQHVSKAKDLSHSYNIGLL